MSQCQEGDLVFPGPNQKLFIQSELAFYNFKDGRYQVNTTDSRHLRMEFQGLCFLVPFLPTLISILNYWKVFWLFKLIHQLYDFGQIT